jgi:hypothetical protein
LNRRKEEREEREEKGYASYFCFPGGCPKMSSEHKVHPYMNLGEEKETHIRKYLSRGKGKGARQKINTDTGSGYGVKSCCAILSCGSGNWEKEERRRG